MRVNIKGCDRIGPPPGARESVPQGHLIVAHYEVVGRVFSKATRPASVRDDRLAACAREAVCEPRTEGSIVPYRDGAVFQLLTQHFRTGLLSNVPAGRGPLRMLLSLMLTRMGSRRTATGEVWKLSEVELT
jgi:hypothetical protein